MRVAIFSIEVPEKERERVLSEEQYAIEAAAEVAYCFELNSLSLALKCWKWQPKELPELTTGGGFISFYVFYLLRLLFHLVMETFYFTVHGNPVSSSFLQIRKSLFVYFLEFVCKQERIWEAKNSFVCDLNEFQILLQRIWEAKITNLDSGLVL